MIYYRNKQTCLILQRLWGSKTQTPPSSCRLELNPPSFRLNHVYLFLLLDSDFRPCWAGLFGFCPAPGSPGVPGVPAVRRINNYAFIHYLCRTEAAQSGKHGLSSTSACFTLNTHLFMRLFRRSRASEDDLWPALIEPQYKEESVVYTRSH